MMRRHPKCKPCKSSQGASVRLKAKGTPIAHLKAQEDAFVPWRNVQYLVPHVCCMDIQHYGWELSADWSYEAVRNASKACCLGENVQNSQAPSMQDTGASPCPPWVLAETL